MLGFWYEMGMLGFEAQQVIWLRSARLASGGTAGEREAKLMVTEKLAAAAQASIAMATGSSVEKVVRQYRKRVQANRRRLTR